MKGVKYALERRYPPKHKGPQQVIPSRQKTNLSPAVRALLKGVLRGSDEPEAVAQVAETPPPCGEFRARSANKP